MARIPEFDPVEFLVQRRYPSALVRFLAAGAATPNPVVDQAGEARAALVDALVGGTENVEAYRQELKAKPAEELALLVVQEKQRQELQRVLAEDTEEKKQLFNQPPATEVDYTHWAKLGTWTISEAVTLSMGRNPKYVSWDLIKAKTSSKFVQAYGQRQELVLRGDLPWQQHMGGHRIRPMELYTWVQKLELDFPEELGKQLVKFAGAVDWRVSYEAAMKRCRELSAKLDEVTQALVAKADEKPVEKAREKPVSVATTERNTLLKMVYAMAKDAYGFTPGMKGSSASDIEKAATSAGIKLDADTARKWLKSAADYCKELGAV